MLRLRLGLFIGFAIGYVLGAKAGRERYQQILELWGTFKSSEPAQQVSADVREAAHRAGDIVEQKTHEGVEKVSGLLGGGEDEPSGGTAQISGLPPA